MKKEGHYLRDIKPRLPDQLVNGLREEFSISTAEEWIPIAARAAESMRSALGVDEETWRDALAKARSVVPRNVLDELEHPVSEKFAKGLRLGTPPTRAGALKKFISGG